MIEEDDLTHAQDGDEEVIEKIYKQYNGLVYRTSRNFFLKGGDFDDLVQEGYIGLMRAISYYDINREVSFSTFADICIKRQMITAIKKYNIKKYRNLNEAIQNDNYSKKNEKIVYDIPSASFYSPEEILLGKELVRLLENYLKYNLSDLEKKVFYYLSKQLTYTEIAEKLNETPKRIDNTIQRIKKKMREYLEKHIK